MSNNLFPKGPRRKDIADIVRHKKMFRIGEDQPIFRKKVQKGPGAVSRIEHLCAEYKNLLLIKILAVFLGKFPHQAGDSGAIDGIADDNPAMPDQQLVKAQILFNGMTGNIHLCAEFSGDIF